ncbi:MAG: hypothetical protein LBT09_03555, partial [Planctomycetaceae bacterium]|nr:hypothetical protein [Planctomycetaceae bacterium]
MSAYKLNSRQIKKLKKKYYKIKKSDPSIANRILIVLALGRGQSASLVADMFLIDSDTVRRYFRLYQEGG